MSQVQFPVITTQLLQAYYQTRYVVTPEQEQAFELRIGQPNVHCDTFLKRFEASAGLFITAQNPFSQSISDSENSEAMDRLERELKDKGLAVTKGYGQAIASEDWPAEDSFFVPMDDFLSAVIIANKYKQSAFVWHKVGQTSELFAGADGEALWLAPGLREPTKPEAPEFVDFEPGKPRGFSLHAQPGWAGRDTRDAE